MFGYFKSSHLLIERATKHLKEFDSLQSEFATKHANAIVCETNAQTGEHIYKLLVNSSLLEDLSVVVFDIVNCLRSALDHAVFDAARAIGGKPDPKGTKYPFGKSSDDASRNLNRHKDGEIPETLKPYLLGFEPYQGGKEGLWELNELRNLKIHQLLQPFAALASQVGFYRVRDGMLVIGMMRFANEWDADKAVLTFLRTYDMDQLKGNPQLVLAVVFSDSKLLGDKPVIDVLRNFTEVLYRVIDGIEAEAARLKRMAI